MESKDSKVFLVPQAMEVALPLPHLASLPQAVLSVELNQVTKQLKDSLADAPNKATALTTKIPHLVL